MTSKLKKLRLSDLVFNRRGSFTFRVILAAFEIALKLFFRRIETVNESVVPVKDGLIFVLNHPNGLIDPALVFVALPRKISFLAKSTLFRMPVISFLLRTVDALPLYRKIDAGEDISKNQKTFELCRDLLQKGGSIALFPEGVSHNSPKLLPLKTGAARIALGAISMGTDAERPNVHIVPVGLFYTNKTTFRSEAMLHFGEPFVVEPVELDAGGQPPREAVRKMTEKIDSALREVTLNAESEAELHTANIAERIFAAGTTDNNIAERFDFLKAYVEEKSDTDKLDGSLRERLAKYDRKLESFGIDAEHLSLSQFSRSFVIRQAFVQTWVLLVLLPFALIGIILHFPSYQLCKIFAKYYARHGADDIASTVKVIAAMVFMPLTWLILAVALYYYWGWPAALLSIPAAFICGYIALYTLEEFEEMRGWAKAIWIFLTRRERFLRLFVERRELQTELREFE
jgi:glycerol-3-phosphate O-acyltransferase/dihydroxyacetone phosphate acyltransferase